MKPTRTIALGLLWLAAAAPISLSALFLGGRFLIREIHWKSDGRGGTFSFDLPIESLVWYEKDRELILDGRMFDVKAIEWKDDVVRVTGFFDDLETNLNRSLEDTNGTGQPGSQSGWRLFQSCLGILGIPPSALFMQTRPPTFERSRLFPNPPFRISEGHRPILSPPPRSLA